MRRWRHGDGEAAVRTCVCILCCYAAPLLREMFSWAGAGALAPAGKDLRNFDNGTNVSGAHVCEQGSGARRVCEAFEAVHIFLNNNCGDVAPGTASKETAAGASEGKSSRVGVQIVVRARRARRATRTRGCAARRRHRRTGVPIWRTTSSAESSTTRTPSNLWTTRKKIAEQRVSMSCARHRPTVATAVQRESRVIDCFVPLSLAICTASTDLRAARCCVMLSSTPLDRLLFPKTTHTPARMQSAARL